MDNATLAAGDLFVRLIGETSPLSEGDEVRSAVGTDFIDVKIKGKWFRLKVNELDGEPISLRQHRDGYCLRQYHHDY